VASQKAGYIALRDCAARERTARAVYDPRHEHASKTDREVAVEPLYYSRMMGYPAVTRNGICFRRRQGVILQ
jgi:hypothetical protein